MRTLLVSLLALISITVSAQIYNPVKWTITLEPIDGGNHLFKASAVIENGWWVYSQFLENEDGPIPTTITYDEGNHFKLVGKNKESENAKKIFDKVFEMEVVKFQKTYTIEQKIKVTDPSKPITGYLNFMTCNDERCLPPTDVEFSLQAKGGSGSSGDAGSKKEVNIASKDKNIAPESSSTASASTAEKPEIEKKKNDLSSTEVNKPAGSGTFSNTNNFNSSNPLSSPGVLRPVKWSFRSEKRPDGLYDIIASATIDEGWQIYSALQQKEGGPVPTSLVLNASSGYTVEGSLRESSSDKKEEFDKYFDMKLIKFKKDATIIQAIRASDPTIVMGYIEFMACDKSRCLAPELIEFKVDLATGKEVMEPTDIAFAGPKIDAGVIDQTVPAIRTSFNAPVSDCGETKTEEKGNLLWMFIFGMINGFVALLTPCVFPMIPLTVSFFTKDTKRKGWQNGLWYGASIILIYVVLGLLVTVLFGAGSLNELSTNPLANTIFFIIFVFFAFSFFGFYEITLPSSWSNKSDALADKGGLLGIFFMAATLAIVSFSCTGPLIGTALVEASSEGYSGPLVVMAGFAIALAIPFSLFAAFPSWLNSLPRSGGWMNSVKVLLGFAELALAFKFLSVADMTAHWGILKYELFMALWVLVALGMTAYMFGLIRFPHDSPNRKLAPLPALLGLGFLVLTVYLATGLLGSKKTGTYNTLGLMSGLAPPAHYNFFKPLEGAGHEINGDYASLTKCANNFNCFHDYYEGLTYAKEQQKPILLDFTGYGCVNCRKTEEHIWSQEQIRQKIHEDFVLISLYVDDKMNLDTSLRSAVTNLRIRTIGQKWTDFQVVNFEQNSQPLYVIMSPDQQVLTSPRGYDPDVDGYYNFLECGWNAFKGMQEPVIGMAD